jgi:hypothetical protein
MKPGGSQGLGRTAPQRVAPESATVENNAAVVSPGVGRLEADILVINGDYTQQESGGLSIELGGATPGYGGYDQLQVTGTATLGGEVHVFPIHPFYPMVGQQFVTLTAGNLYDCFTLVSGGGQYTADCSNGADVVVTTICPQMGDLDCDGDVDMADFAIFQTGFAGPQ